MVSTINLLVRVVTPKVSAIFVIVDEFSSLKIWKPCCQPHRPPRLEGELHYKCSMFLMVKLLIKLIKILIMTFNMFDCRHLLKHGT